MVVQHIFKSHLFNGSFLAGTANRIHTFGGFSHLCQKYNLEVKMQSQTWFTCKGSNITVSTMRQIAASRDGFSQDCDFYHRRDYFYVHHGPIPTSKMKLVPRVALPSDRRKLLPQAADAVGQLSRPLVICCGFSRYSFLLEDWYVSHTAYLLRCLN